jgi:hypothetical protein
MSKLRAKEFFAQAPQRDTTGAMMAMKVSNWFGIINGHGQFLRTISQSLLLYDQKEHAQAIADDYATFKAMQALGPFTVEPVQLTRLGDRAL